MKKLSLAFFISLLPLFLFAIDANVGFINDPVLSPDGTKIAFSASPDGNTNVFVMPADGGEITQLTFHEAPDMLDSWSWDNQSLYFHSSRESSVATGKIRHRTLFAQPKGLIDISQRRLENHLPVNERLLSSSEQCNYFAKIQLSGA